MSFLPTFSKYTRPGALLLLAFLLAFAAPEATAQVRQASLEQLTQASTTILVGKAGAQESFWNADRTKIFTRVTVEVDEAIKGRATGQATFLVPGGRVGNIGYEVSDMPVFVEGEEVLLFLRQVPSGEQVITGATLGKMTVVEDPRSGGRVVRHAPQLLRTLTETAGAPVASGGVMTLDQMRRTIRMIGQQ